MPVSVGLGFMGLPWLAGEPTDLHQARGGRLKLKVIFSVSKNDLQEKVRIEISYEKSPHKPQQKFASHVFMAHSTGRSRRNKMFLYSS